MSSVSLGFYREELWRSTTCRNAYCGNRGSLTRCRHLSPVSTQAAAEEMWLRELGAGCPKKIFCRSGGEKCFSLDIPFTRTSRSCGFCGKRISPQLGSRILFGHGEIFTHCPDSATREPDWLRKPAPPARPAPTSPPEVSNRYDVSSLHSCERRLLTVHPPHLKPESSQLG